MTLRTSNLRTTLNIQDPLFISAPNGGGLLYAHRHLLMPMTDEDATGLALTKGGLMWCVQAEGSRTFREIREGILSSAAVSQQPLDLHDVMVESDDIYAVFTETNQVVRLDQGYRVRESWSFGDEPDSAHVNCIAMYSGRLIASMFGPFTSHRGYKGETRRAGRVVDVRTGEPLIEGLSQPHSLVVVGEQLWLCSSEDRSVNVYDRNFRIQRQVSLSGYTRGLAVGKSSIYVGLSRSRNLKSGEVGDFTTAIVAVLDRESFNVIGYMPIPWNEIYDIRVAPSADLVADVMASTWMNERELSRAALEQSKQSLAETVQQLRDRDSDLEVAMDKLQRATQKAETAELLRTQLIELRGETVKRNARIHLLEQARAELELIKNSRSWRWTRLLRFVTRAIENRGLSMEDRRKLMRLPSAHKITNGAVADASADSSEPGLALYSGSRLSEVNLAQTSGAQRDFFVWGVIDWHFRIQRPQHLARELAVAGHRVFYISNNFIDRHEPGFAVESLDSEGRLFQVYLHLPGSPMIYHASPDEAAKAQLRADVGMLLTWTSSRSCASLIQHPYWLETAQILPNQRTVYDCMDHHGGFADNSEEVLAREHELMREADLLVVTSDWLDHEAGKYNSHRLMIRNACQYEHFSTRPASVFKDDRGRKVIGYYGAIAEWFDMELLEKVARRFSDCLVLLVGSDTCGARQSLSTLENVSFIGEVPYANLPYYLEGFDVCLLPFQIIPLTLATNPVKIYEYLSAGKEVVSIALPEIKQFGDLVRTGTDHATFLTALDEALHAPPDAQERARRRQFANEQTWSHRVQDLVQGIENLSEPRVSVVVVTYNNLDLTQACLHSLEQYSEYANLEIIVVDNASADGTPNYLRTWAEQKRDRHILLNEENLGFAAANNQGLALASGDYLVMLNNDTYVTPGWISTLVRHLRCKEKLGMVGPVTNNIGNEARIDIRYDSMDEMLKVAGKYTRGHAGKLTALRTAAFFCVMMRREVYQRVGPLDEEFGIGFFEDDDYCRRVEEAGWTIACADDVFVHHNLSASFSKLKHETRQALFEQNKGIYEAKWGAWTPHKYRDE